MTDSCDPPESFNGHPRLDENGVDLDVLETFMRLTPTERLRRVEEFAQFILIARESKDPTSPMRNERSPQMLKASMGFWRSGKKISSSSRAMAGIPRLRQNCFNLSIN
jgi:hypothetical protein